MNEDGKIRSALVFGIGFVLVAACAYLTFELGRIRAGYSLIDQQRRLEAMQNDIDQRDQLIDELRRQNAILETSRDIDRETYQRVEADLSRLQSTIQSQEEQLAFYQGIVSPEDGVAGLRIQNLEIQPTDAEQRHLLRLLLVQALVQRRRVSGTVQVKLAGNIGNNSAEFDLEQLLASDEVPDFSYGFRYFQSFEQELVLPPGFEPETVEVVVVPREPRGEPFTQSFQWAAVSISG